MKYCLIHKTYLHHIKLTSFPFDKRDLQFLKELFKQNKRRVFNFFQSYTYNIFYFMLNKLIIFFISDFEFSLSCVLCVWVFFFVHFNSLYFLHFWFWFVSFLFLLNHFFFISFNFHLSVSKVIKSNIFHSFIFFFLYNYYKITLISYIYFLFFFCCVLLLLPFPVSF